MKYLVSGLLCFSFLTPVIAATQYRDGLNIKDNTTSYDIDASMPGMNKENVKVSLNGNEVTVTGETRNEVHKADKNMQSDEVSVGRFTRSVMLKDPVDPKSLDVTFDKDLIHIHLNKKKVSM